MKGQERTGKERTGQIRRGQFRRAAHARPPARNARDIFSAVPVERPDCAADFSAGSAGGQKDSAPEIPKRCILCPAMAVHTQL